MSNLLDALDVIEKIGNDHKCERHTWKLLKQYVCEDCGVKMPVIIGDGDFMKIPDEITMIKFYEFRKMNPEKPITEIWQEVFGKVKDV